MSLICLSFVPMIIMARSLCLCLYKLFEALRLNWCPGAWLLDLKPHWLKSGNDMTEVNVLTCVFSCESV